MGLKEPVNLAWVTTRKYQYMHPIKSYELTVLHRRLNSFVNAELECKISSFEMRSYRQLKGITYLQRITNETVRRTITNTIGKHQKLLEIVTARKLK